MEKTARVLVTGGSGMVGRALVKRLRRDGYERILAPSSQELDLRNQAATHQFFTRNPVDGAKIQQVVADAYKVDPVLAKKAGRLMLPESK